MSNVVSISVEKREEFGKGATGRLRKEGKIPAVIYGRGFENISMSVAEADVPALLSHTGMVEITGDFMAKSTAILKEVEHNPITGKVIHIDFHAVKADEVVVVPVPVFSVGEAAGLKAGGQLEQVMHEIEIECLPTAVPESVKIDVSALELDQAFHIADLKLEDGLKAIGEADQIIFHVRAPRAEVAAEAAEAPAEEAKK